MQHENIKDTRKATENVELNKYEIAISDILNSRHHIETAAITYELNINYLDIFIHTIISKGKVVKGDNKNFSFLDELSFLLYIKMCPQEHCVCLTCFKDYLPSLIYKFMKNNNLAYPKSWDTCQKADELSKVYFLEKNEDKISKLFSKNCSRLSPQNLTKKSLDLDGDSHDSSPNTST